LTQNIEGQLQLLDGRISGLTSGVDRQVHELSDRVDSRLELLGRRAADLASSMDRQIDRLETTVDGKLEDISGVLSTRTSEVNAVLGTRVEELASAFEHQISQFDAKAGDRITGLSAALGERGDQFVRLLDGTGAALTENLTQRLLAIKVDIERASTTAAETLDRGATTLVQSFEGGVRDFSESVARSSAELRGTVDESTRHSIDALANAHETVRGEIGGILDRLSAANGLLQQIMSGAGQSLGALESGLAKRLKDLEYLLGGIVSETNRAASRVADQVGALNSVSSSTLRNAENLLEKLESQAHALADATEAQTRGWNEAADLLERVEARIARSLATKRDALETLTASIGDRSEELEKVTGAFRELIEDSLGAAEEKARRISDVLGENARASVAAINEQFTHIRSSAGAERERTATALREAYESVMGDMNETFGQATSRFRDAAAEMRQITAQIQREMEITRAELHRGLVELPRETQASAGEMRRVVGEQIKVLNELTAIATRSVSSVDAVEPATTGVAQQREARPAQATGLAPRAPSPSRTAGTEGTRRPATANPSSGSTQSSPRERRAETTPPPREDGLPRSGWLSDLLSRASREEPLPAAANRPPAGTTPAAPSPTPAQPSLGSLDTIAVDIARMIDHDVAAKMWDRYQEGEQGVFNRSMYTAQGQQMFDEIKRKYRRDEAFRDAAHRYVEEFERLLGEVARDPATQRGYLTSDTGKVYTILAHASGRLD
jgi:ABC-type transporter Mla subunit MlaD